MKSCYGAGDTGINDFDEVYPGPWEWDLKRLAASAVVAGRENGFKEEKCKQLAVVVSQAYRKAMQRFAEERIMDVWYYHVEAETVLDVFDKHSKTGAESAELATHASAATIANDFFILLFLPFTVLPWDSYPTLGDPCRLPVHPASTAEYTRCAC